MPAAAGPGGSNKSAKISGSPRFRPYGVGAEHADSLCEKAARASSMKGNPVALTRDELRAALLAAL
jgi:hypothetical protein